MKVLIVEDDLKIASFIEKGLKEAGFIVDSAVNGEQALQMAVEAQYSVAVVDIMLPILDGLCLVEKLRQNGINMPVLILSAKHTVNDRVRGLQRGADDYSWTALHMICAPL